MTELMQPKQRTVLLVRIFLGLAYGLLLFWQGEFLTRDNPLFGFEEGDDWKHFVHIVRLLVWFGPLPLLFGVGRIGSLRLGLWSVSALFLLLIFGWFGPTTVWGGVDPLINVSLFSLIVLFIAHEFVQGAVDDKRALATYKTYFENAWGRGFQVLLALGFLGAYWVVISLGAWLFEVIGLGFIRRAIFSSEFSWVSSGVVFAIGTHLADVNIALVRGARQIGLLLLSWLAVLMTVILTAFLAALCFTGLQPLWDTGRATVLLLNAAATMILLINAAYQDGSVATSKFMRLSVRFAALPLLGIILIAAIGLWLRIDQYGLTPARVLAGIELLIVAIYGVGYGVAAVKPGRWMAMLEHVNIGAAIAVAVLLSALMTPILSPARMSVANQVSRLDRGAVEPDAFDFGFLANARSGKWGERALEQLAARSGTPRDERIALLAQNPGEQQYGRSEQSIVTRQAALRLLGEGEIPDGVLLPRQDFDPISECLDAKRNFDRRAAESEATLRQPKRLRPQGFVSFESEDRPLYDGRCLVRLLDIDFDGDEDALVMPATSRGFFDSRVLLQGEEEAWKFIGSVSIRPGVGSNTDPIEFGTLSDDERKATLVEWLNTVQVVPALKKDLMGLGERYQLATALAPLSKDEIRTRILTTDERAVPEGLLVDGEELRQFRFCSAPGSGDERKHVCLGRYFELSGTSPEEYVVIMSRFDGFTIKAFEERNGEWLFFGGADRVDLRDYGRANDNQTDTVDSNNMDPVAMEEILNDLRPVEPLAGDLRWNDIQYSINYP